jgi:hypothetical protein
MSLHLMSPPRDCTLAAQAFGDGAAVERLAPALTNAFERVREFGLHQPVAGRSALPPA